MDKKPSRFLIISVSAVLFLIIRPDWPDFMFYLAKIILFFSVAATIAFFIANPVSFSLLMRKISFYFKGLTGQTTAKDGSPVLDVSSMNMQELLENLNHYMSRPGPITLAGKDQLNHQLSLDVEKLRILRENIYELNQGHIDLSDLKATTLFEAEMTQSFLSEARTARDKGAEYRRNEYDRVIDESKVEKEKKRNELKRENNELKMQTLRTASERKDIEMKKHELKRQKAELERYKKETKDFLDINKYIDLMRAQADVYSKNSKTIKELELVSFIQDFMKKVDINKLPEHIQAYLLQVFIHPNGDAKEFADFDMMQKFKDFYMSDIDRKGRERDIDLENKGFERDTNRAQRDVDNLHKDLTKAEIERNREEFLKKNKHRK